VCASKDKIALTDPQLKGITGVEIYRTPAGLWGYTVGNYKTRNEARAALPAVKEKIPGAFIVKFVNGERAN